MDLSSHNKVSIGASSMFNVSNNKTPNDDLNSMLSTIPTTDENEVDVLNDETFGDCDLEAIKIKSDFGENGEFLGDFSSDQLPDFFSSDIPDEGGGISLIEDDDQSQQPSIDALLGEDPMSISSVPLNLRPSTMNPLFNMAISQANNGNLFPQPPMTLPAPMPPQQQQQPQINYDLLKQFEQMLISRQVPAQERLIYIQALFEKMQRDVINMQQQTTRMGNLNVNGHNRSNEMNSNRILNNNRNEGTRPMAIGEMMERARLTAMNINNSRSQSPIPPSSGISSQFMDAIQRSDQIPIVDNQQNRINNQVAPSSSPLEPIGSPPSHHHNQSRQNRPAKHYPRPPLLNTWQGRGPGHDEFAGMMNDREKQWVVKIQLHQATQTLEEDFYYNKWLQQKRHTHNNQSNRHGHRGQKISYPVLQLLKSIQQENELAQRLSQTSTQAMFSNVNPAQSLPYALPLPTQLGKQSVATPRHPRCTLNLGGVFTLGRRKNAITHDKYTLGILLNIENIYRDLLRLDNNHDNEVSNNTESANTNPQVAESVNQSKQLLTSILDRYLNDQTYLFIDTFGQFSKGQLIFHRLYPYIKNTDDFEKILSRLYSSLSYMIHQWPNTFHIESIVMNTIHLMQQQMIEKKSTFEQCLSQAYTYYNENIKEKLPNASSSPFSEPVLFTNPYTVTILMDLLLSLERYCYLLPDTNTTKLPIQILQQLQPQLQYQLSEQIRLIVTDLCQALLNCSSPVHTLKKTLRPFTQAKHQQFTLLCKFIRIQVTPQVYASLEPKLIYCCIKDN